jgi:hypothetical protein
MSDRRQHRVILHGAIVLMIGLLCGLPFGSVAARAAGDDAARAWRVAHSGGTAVGVMLIAIAAALPRLRLADRAASLLACALIVSAYSFTAGVLLAASTGARGLGAGASILDAVVFLAYLVGALGSLLAVALTICGAAAALRHGNDARPSRP